MRNSPAMLEQYTDPNSEENLPTSLKEKVKKASRITTALCLAAIDASLFLPGDSRPYRLEGLTTDGDPRHPTELTIYRLIPDENSDPAHTDKELYDMVDTLNERLDRDSGGLMGDISIRKIVNIPDEPDTTEKRTGEACYSSNNFDKYPDFVNVASPKKDVNSMAIIFADDPRVCQEPNSPWYVYGRSSDSAARTRKGTNYIVVENLYGKEPPLVLAHEMLHTEAMGQQGHSARQGCDYTHNLSSSYKPIGLKLKKGSGCEFPERRPGVIDEYSDWTTVMSDENTFSRQIPLLNGNNLANMFPDEHLSLEIDPNPGSSYTLSSEQGALNRIIIRLPSDGSHPLQTELDREISTLSITVNKQMIDENGNYIIDPALTAINQGEGAPQQYVLDIPETPFEKNENSTKTVIYSDENMGFGIVIVGTLEDNPKTPPTLGVEIIDYPTAQKYLDDQYAQDLADRP